MGVGVGVGVRVSVSGSRSLSQHVLYEADVPLSLESFARIRPGTGTRRQTTGL